MNRRIPPDELPWFKRNPTEVTPTGQLLYGCPVLLGNTATLYSPVTFLFPYISRVWSVYQPRILVVDAYPSNSELFHIAQSGSVDVYSTNENPATSSMVIDVAHHYDLILSNYILCPGRRYAHFRNAREASLYVISMGVFSTGY